MEAKAAKRPSGSLVHLKRIPIRAQRHFTEKNAAEFLDGRGLVEAERAAADIESWPRNKVELLCDDLFDFLEQQRSTWEKAGAPEISPFNCLASSSIRGDSGCSNPSCRAAKLDLLSQFAAMYADQVFLPVPLRSPGESGTNAGIRNGLIQTVTSILELRPLVERDIVRPTMRLLHYCSECAHAAMSEYQEGEEAITELAVRNSSDFEFSYELIKDRPKMLALRLQGPEEYIEHGSLYRLLPETPRWAQVDLAPRKVVRLPRNSPIHTDLVRSVLYGIGRDVIFHQQFGPQFNATYLTDLAGEARFLQLLSEKDDLAISTAQLFANLAHEIPFIRDLPIRTILKIRDENPASFQFYRSALKSIVKEHVHRGQATTAGQAHEIYEDILAPALAELRVEAERQHTRWVRKSVATAALAIGAVSLGATGVLQSQQVLQMLGGATLKGLADQLAESNTESVTSNKLYFLLRLQREATGRRRFA